MPTMPELLALAMAAACPQSSTPRDGILNGGFEGVFDVSGKPMNTGLWVVGGEDEQAVYIPNDPGGWYLELQRQLNPLRGHDIYTGELIQGAGDLVSVFGHLYDPEYDVGTHKMPFLNLAAVDALLGVYAARVAGNPSSQAGLESACGNCIETARFFRNPPVYFDGGDWAAVWQSHDGDFNDHFGYQSRDAIRMHQALLELHVANNGLSPGEGIMKHALEEFWLADGTQSFYEPWAQIVARNEFVPGDHARGWLAFLYVIQNTDITLPTGADREDFEQLLKTAAFHALKFQHVGGIWNSGGLGRFQQADLGSVNLGPPAVYITGIANALALPNLSADEEGYLLSALMAILEANQRHFKDEFGYWPNLYLEPPASGEWTAGAERRSLGGFLDVLDALDRIDPPPTPPQAVIVSPASGQHTTGSVTYEFKLVVPGAVTNALLDAALEERTRLIRWDGDSLSEWAPTYFNTDTTTDDITVSAR
jgi:hypothetical protein